MIIESPVSICKNYESNESNCILHRTGDYVPTLYQPSLETFLRDFLKPQLPLKITGKIFEYLNSIKYYDIKLKY